jgi:hypothetical protein
MSLVHRADLVAEQLASPPWGRHGFASDDPPVRIGTTGSGKDLVLLGWTAGQLAAEIAAGTRLFGASASRRACASRIRSRARS